MFCSVEIFCIVLFVCCCYCSNQINLTFIKTEVYKLMKRVERVSRANTLLGTEGTVKLPLIRVEGMPANMEAPAINTLSTMFLPCWICWQFL